MDVLELIIARLAHDRFSFRAVPARVDVDLTAGKRELDAQPTESVAKRQAVASETESRMRRNE
jgi:hypothetical protein